MDAATISPSLVFQPEIMLVDQTLTSTAQSLIILLYTSIDA